ncbi:alpha/beta hydrolase family protein [Actinophytocola algeriensis]|uniref:Pimeloyl-ACP methyl ester carboxylesterase n=1 Tax=Actinophytocola algeriensis TaxID=1768010 RepID=A0A7W7Q987_9PSEU|nr:alpha/beta fold hydrolase [Actinophytocola algeriensis]MBB4909395.1 pimeloyl-ACP methyl ester carboxylesterase [Actinophytocola algeriensis]MBE1475385.1 pimeloyl-ACP methyl ester carboxylesterase [Actinophytocola algeriensis]
MKRLRTLVAVAAVAAGLVSGPATATATATTTAGPGPGRHTYTGSIDGAEYRVETPARWNGTLILFSHGYIPDMPGFPPGITLAHRAETEQWLLDHGYALAGSDYKGRFGMLVEEALTDQMALLDWFEDTVGEPRRTVSSGFSMGGGIATHLAELHPDRFDGVLAIGSLQDMPANLNRGLDVTFAVRTLLTDDQRLELVKATDPVHSVQVLQQGVQQALTTPEGRAKLALIGAVGQLPRWATAHSPRPTDLVEAIRQQAWWTEAAYVASLGPTGRVDIERRAGGNPSSNVGVDYTRQLVRSGDLPFVAEAYRASGADLRADLRALVDAPRIAADEKAVAWATRYGVSAATTPTPVVTLHGMAEGIITSDARWYGEQVRHHGDPNRLRQLYVDRGDHGAFSAADEIIALTALLHRIETGRWQNLGPRTLNAKVATFTPQQQTVFDIYTFADKVVPPAFTNQQPPKALRPTR